MRRHPAVREAVVVGRARGRKLTAYVKLITPAAVRLADLLVDLRRELPAHMVPSIVIRVDRMPLTARGKLDRTALSQLSATTRW